jgi:hypothetical protein
MNLIIILIISFFTLFSGNRVSDVQVFLEDGAGNKRIAFQKTGTKGETGFAYLDAGSYQLLIEFPQQEGKYIKEKERHRTLTKATYNEKKKTYYYQGLEGFYAVKFKKRKKIDRDSFRAVFEESRGVEEERFTIAYFLAKRDGAEISVIVKALTAKQFKKATYKIGNDISTMSILNIK